MKQFIILGLLLFNLKLECFSQSFLLFKKNNRRQAYYKVGDIVSFNVKGSRSKITEEIKGLEDSLITFQYYKVNTNEISHIYVDNKTKIWFIFRYKYQRAFPIAGFGLLFLGIVNSGNVNNKALFVSGILVGTGLLAKTLISPKLKIKGKRKLLIIND